MRDYRLYDGPQAGLVRWNVVLGCVALFPAFLIIIFLLSGLASKVLGDAAMIPGVIAAVFLVGIGEGAYILALPFLLFAVIFLRRLVRSQEIPESVKKRTTLFVAGALLVMFASVGLLYLAARHGRFKGFFM